MEINRNSEKCKTYGAVSGDQDFFGAPVEKPDDVRRLIQQIDGWLAPTPDDLPPHAKTATGFLLRECRAALAVLLACLEDDGSQEINGHWTKPALRDDIKERIKIDPFRAVSLLRWHIATIYGEHFLKEDAALCAESNARAAEKRVERLKTMLRYCIPAVKHIADDTSLDQHQQYGKLLAEIEAEIAIKVNL